MEEQKIEIPRECTFFKINGYCKHGNKCRYNHRTKNDELKHFGTANYIDNGNSIYLYSEFNKESLSCLICYESLTTKIFSCENGHNICIDCEEGMRISNNLEETKCPLCKVKTLNNFGFLEKFLKQFITPCKYIKSGCEFKCFGWENDKYKDHHKLCLFKNGLECYLCNKIIKKNKNNKKSSILDHITSHFINNCNERYMEVECFNTINNIRFDFDSNEKNLTVINYKDVLILCKKKQNNKLKYVEVIAYSFDTDVTCTILDKIIITNSVMCNDDNNSFDQSFTIPVYNLATLNKNLLKSKKIVCEYNKSYLSFDIFSNYFYIDSVIDVKNRTNKWEEAYITECRYKKNRLHKIKIKYTKYSRDNYEWLLLKRDINRIKRKGDKTYKDYVSTNVYSHRNNSWDT